MNNIIILYFSQRTEQILKSSQSASITATTSAENVESVNVNKEFLEVLNISYGLQIQGATAFLEKKDLIDTIESKIEMLYQNIITLEAQEKDVKFDDIIALAITYYNMALVYSDLKLQDLVMSESHFITCIKLLKERELERKVILTMISSFIKLNIISYKREELEESYSFLCTAIELYLKYTKEEIEYPDPINLVAILGIDNENKTNTKIILEELHLAALLNMLTLYIRNFRDKHKFVIYIHNILNKLIETVSHMSSYHVDWAITSCHLSQYFVYNYRLTEARNHIIAAKYMMLMFDEKVIQSSINSEEKAFFLEQKKHVYNNVLKLWGLYGAALLIASTNASLQRKEDNKSYETNNSKSESFMGSKEDCTQLLIFTHIGKVFENFASRFSDKCVSNLNDAKVIFLDVLKCFDAIKEYFTIEEYPEDFLDITIATSKVYKCLTIFEQVRDKQVLLHKQRIQILRNAFDELTETNLRDLKVRCPGILLRIIQKIENELTKSLITILDIETDHLQLNRTFTDEIEKSIKQSIIDIIKIFDDNNIQ